MLKKTKLKKVSLTKLKQKADSAFSLFIRNKYADEDGNVQCYTCHFRGKVNQLHCGHFVSRVYLNTRYDERNCRPQCAGCNIFGNGKAPEFAIKLMAEYGESIIGELYTKGKTLSKNFDYQAIIDKYGIYHQELAKKPVHNAVEK